MTLSGVLNLDKPAGLTSARVVGAVKRLLPRGTKIGHAGTLDQFATGVLLLLIGRATKSCEMLMGQPKQYEATFKLGATTSTLDPESEEIPFLVRPGSRLHSVSSLTHDQVLAALQPMIGNIQQIPPDFSALKVGGKRASDRIRAGETLQLQPRTIRIDAIDVLEFERPFVRLRIDCGRGTYVRSIARDLGIALNVGGYLTQLRRTRVGAFHIEKAIQLETIQSLGTVESVLVDPSVELSV